MRLVAEIRSLITEMDELRAELVAHGVPLRTVRMMVELGVQDQHEKQAALIDSSLVIVEQELGAGVIPASCWSTRIATIASLEKDLSHARQMARDQGMDAQAVSYLDPV